MTEFLRILVAEDNLGDVAILEHILEGRDVEVRAVPSLARLQEEGAHWDPDVILLDLHLEDSQDFMKTARTVVTEFPHTPVLAITGLDETAFALRALQAGIAAYLIKGTLSGPELMRNIQEAIARKKAQPLSMRSGISQEGLREIIETAVADALSEKEEEKQPTSNRVLAAVALAIVLLLGLVGGLGWWGYSQVSQIRHDRETQKEKEKAPVDDTFELLQEFRGLQSQYKKDRREWEQDPVGPPPKKSDRFRQLEQELNAREQGLKP